MNQIEREQIAEQALGQARDFDSRSQLDLEFQNAIAGDLQAQANWQKVEGGGWAWQSDGLTVKNEGSEWSACEWKNWNRLIESGVSNFLIEVTVSGKAEAAGLSFGPYKDFLATFDNQEGAHHLQLEADARGKCWAFRVDGKLMTRCWWDSAIHNLEDLIGGTLTLKAKSPEQVRFQNLTFRAFESSCKLSVIITCYRLLQRLRISLRNWCHQQLPVGAYELLIVNPKSPDGTHEHLAAVSRSFPNVRVREIVVDTKFARNKGAMINRALTASQGNWIWLTDADCIFAPNAVEHVMSQIESQKSYLYYGERRYLSAAQTDALLTGRLDALNQFDDLARSAYTRAPESEPYGYTQIVHRSTIDRVRYTERINHFAYSDCSFIEECKQNKIIARSVEGLFCLHMDHPFSWYGTNIFL